MKIVLIVVFAALAGLAVYRLIAGGRARRRAEFSGDPAEADSLRPSRQVFRAVRAAEHTQVRYDGTIGPDS
ncbi:hypothetical protein [Cryptosporangium phraense]|uniref:hypothetical protein n=1 Tax=Cryptosporangium phraense TaxID=2593070 RepID=UPI0014782941|nr:hypothetical protein [Cryptosporangium phraense]